MRPTSTAPCADSIEAYPRYQEVGKGEPMSKRNKTNRKRARKIHLTDADKILVALEEIAMQGGPDAATANSLKLWYIEHKSWSAKQWDYAKAIVRKSKDKPKASKPKKYYLYALVAGPSVKLGFSSNIKARVKQMQTGQAHKLECVWRYYTGVNQVEAKKLESKLHRWCSKWKIRGEWYAIECLPTVEKCTVNDKTKKQFHQDRADESILNEIPECF